MACWHEMGQGLWRWNCTIAARVFWQDSRVGGWSKAIALRNAGGILRKDTGARTGQLLSFVAGGKKMWVFFHFFSFFNFLLFCFLKEKKYSEDTKQTLVRWHPLFTSPGDQMAHLFVTLKSVTPLAVL